MKSFTLITILSTAVALVYAQIVFDPTTSSFKCPVNTGPAPMAYCSGDSLATNIIIRCNGLIGQPGNCNDNLAGITPIGVKSFAPCYQSSPLVGDAACSYQGIAYPDNGAPFRIASNVGTSTSSFAAISTRNISTSVLGTQATRKIIALSTGSASTVSISQDGALSAPYVSYRFGFTAYRKGTQTANPATQTILPVELVSTTYLTNDVHESIFNHRFTALSVLPSVQPPVSFGLEETPAAPVIVVIKQEYSRPILEQKGLWGFFKRSNTTSLQGTTGGGTAAGTGGPVQTGSPLSPISGGSTVKGAGAWIIGFSMVALTAVMH